MALIWLPRYRLSEMKILLLLTSAFMLGSASGILVDTSSGPIEGTSENVDDGSVQVFLGIPYAQPPLRSLRFLKPKPVEPWTETLMATNMPPACTQYTKAPFPWFDDQPGDSEDCLYLNIYAPIYAKKGSKLAVLFWIHGGGWLFGSSRQEEYNATALAYRGNIIVVTFNYRLNVLGFLTSNTTDAPGNVGMFDQYAALQWVRENIESFGGDKERITLAGESAGSISVTMFCASPLAKGMFSRAIVESGAYTVITTDQIRPNMDISQKVAVAVGCASDDRTIESDPKTVVDCLRNQNASDLSRALWSVNPTATVYYWPQYGDELFPSSTVEDIRKGNFNNVSLLIGNTLDEGPFLVTTGDPEKFGFFGQKESKMNKAYADKVFKKFFGKEGHDYKKYAKHFLEDVPDDDYDAIRNQTAIAAGDQILVCPTVYFAEKYAEKNNDVYFYLFTHRPSNSPWSSWMGTEHFEEVQFVFGRPILKPELYEPDEIELSKKMIEVWAVFVKDGIPTYTFNWPKYSKEKPNFVYIDTAFKGDLRGTGPHVNNCNYLRGFFEV